MARIAIVGYGKMGQTIEKIALKRGNTVPVIIDANNTAELALTTLDNVDVAIEFTRPETAVSNLKTMFSNRIPVVCGTTGWLDQKQTMEELAMTNGAALFATTNFSVGVNLFFHLNKQLAKLMNNFPDYNVEMEEIHHVHKLDAPSGTALTLSEGIFENVERKTDWELDQESNATILNIKHKREGEVPGTHVVTYHSPIDTIEISHTAHNRQGFALGAVLAAEFLAGKKGIFGMEDLLKL